MAFGQPQKIINEFGFVLCCGFYFIKYSEKTKNIFDDIMNTTDISKDDQVLFNHFIYKNKKQIVRNDKNNIICKNIILNNNLTIGMIKENCISRKYKNNLYCYHPHLEDPIVHNKLILLIRRLLK